MKILFSCFIFIFLTVNSPEMAHAIQCNECSSDILETCATLQFNEKDKELPSVLCVSDVTSCFTKTQNETTTRGCVTNEKDFYSLPNVGENEHSFEICSFDYCNGDIFPEDRLSCLHCEGSACVDQSRTEGVGYSCSKYLNGDSCYSIFSRDGGFAYRGCMSDESPGTDFCLKHNQQCMKCSERGCNDDRLGWGKPLSCVKCTSSSDENCETAVESFDSVECEPIVLGYLNRCFTHTNDSIVQRGCLFEAPEEIQNNCYKSTDDSCLLCSESNCNNVKAYVGDYCYECDSSEDSNCTNNVLPYMEKKCESSRRGCYLMRQNQHINNIPEVLRKVYINLNHARRGCASDLTNGIYEKCVNGEENCKLCEGLNCNEKAKPQICKRCDSETDDRCLNRPWKVPSLECDNYIDQCATVMHTNGTIVRDCQRSLDVAEDHCVEYPWLCITCEHDNCNTITASDDSCYECDSKSDPKCHNNIDGSMLVNCPFSKHRGCYHFINSTDSSVSRGCVANLDDPQNFEMCKESSDICKICVENECNFKENFPQCIQKSVTIENKMKGSDWKICDDYNDKCFIYVDKESVTRGCIFEHMNSNIATDDDLIKHFNSSTYRICSTPLCNDDEIEIEFCIACDSQDTNCKNDVTSKMHKICRLAQGLKGCYHFDDGHHVQRGCISEIEDVTFEEICESNSDNCKKCIGNDCNSRQTDFQRCLVSDHVNVQKTNIAELESQICTTYTDECYTHVSNDIVRRGCLSNVADIQLSCNNPDNCEKCSGTIDCNNKTIEKEYCTVCDSESESSCIGEPSASTRAQCPLAIRPLGCLTYQNEKNVVKRDCMSSDSSMRQLCLDGNDDCQYCVGNECNKNPSFLQCYSCSSKKSDEHCINQPGEVELKTCKHYSKECFTLVSDNGTVTRGCSSDFIGDIGDCSNIDTCLRCSGETGCNNVFIESESCVSCESNDNSACILEPLTSSEICPRKTIRPQGCYHFIDDSNEYTRRGCISTLPPQDKVLALGRSNEWKHCIGQSNCNSRIAFQKCFSCNSANNTNCFANQSSSNTVIGTCGNYEDACYSYIGLNSIMRGCLSDLDEKSIEKCHQSQIKCETCGSKNGQACNDRKYNENRCITCDSGHDNNCRNQPELFSPQLCSSVNLCDDDLGCFLIRDGNNKVRRGCELDLSAEFKDKCSGESNHCKICKGNNCNKKVEFQHCYICTSEDDSNCVETASTNELVICPNYQDKCLTAIDSANFTIRQCVSSKTLPNLDTLLNFEVCDENSCNGNIFPEDRLQCFQCDGESTCDLLQTDQNETLEQKPCQIYSEHDQCFTYIDGNQNIHRGCLTDLKESRLLCTKHSDACAICDQDGCNNEPNNIQPKLSCYDCEDSTNCGYGQADQQKIKKCVEAVRFGSSESCYTRSLSDGKVERGCTLDIVDENPNWCIDDENCTECEDYACNSKNINFSYCLQCDSEFDKNCSIPIPSSNEFYVQCTSVRNNDSEEIDDSDETNKYDGSVEESSDYELFDPYPFSKRGCFTIKRNGNVQRGCVSNMSEVQHKSCKMANWCKLCEKEYCNDQRLHVVLVSAGSRSNFSLFITSAVLSVLKTYVKF